MKNAGSAAPGVLADRGVVRGSIKVTAQRHCQGKAGQVQLKLAMRIAPWQWAVHKSSQECGFSKANAHSRNSSCGEIEDFEQMLTQECCRPEVDTHTLNSGPREVWDTSHN